MSPREIEATTAVVTIAHGRHGHLSRQRASLLAGTVLPDLHVVVAMDDPALLGATFDDMMPTLVAEAPASEAGLPLAAARNLGFARALELGADVVIGLDVDCLAGPGLMAAYADATELRADVLWSGPVTYLPASAHDCDLTALDALDDPHPARPAPRPGERFTGGVVDHFWSLSYAVSAEAWDEVGGFCERYVGYGGEDTDLAEAWVAAGAELGWTGDARAYHQHHPTQDPPVQHLDDILRNGAVFAERWGRWPMLGWLSAFEERGLVRRHGDGWERAE